MVKRSGSLARAFVGAAALLAVTSAANAQAAPAQTRPEACPDGRLASGDCANPGASSYNRRTGVALTQQKLSFTGLPLRSDLNGPGNLNNQAGPDLAYTNSGNGGQPDPAASNPGTFVYVPPGVNPASLNIGRPFTVVPGGIILR